MILCSKQKVFLRTYLVIQLGGGRDGTELGASVQTGDHRHDDCHGRPGGSQEGTDLALIGSGTIQDFQRLLEGSGLRECQIERFSCESNGTRLIQAFNFLDDAAIALVEHIDEYRWQDTRQR